MGRCVFGSVHPRELLRDVSRSSTVAGLVAFALDARAGIGKQRLDSCRTPFAFSSSLLDSLGRELGHSLSCDLVMEEQNDEA